MASSTALLVCVFLIFSSIAQSLATTYTVGDTQGWASGVDYNAWAKGKTFKVGDKLVFNYGTSHTVDEVSESDYKTCTTGNALSSEKSGPTTITLKAGTHYYICGVPGHCDNGMKLSVNIGGAATAAPDANKPIDKTPVQSSAVMTPSSLVGVFISSLVVLPVIVFS